MEVTILTLHFGKVSRGRIALGTKFFEGGTFRDFNDFIPEGLTKGRVQIKKNKVWSLTIPGGEGVSENQTLIAKHSKIIVKSLQLIANCSKETTLKLGGGGVNWVWSKTILLKKNI